MKKFMLLSGILLLTILWGNQGSIAQESDVPELATGNYLTIGAFQVQENAIKLKEYINANGQYEAKIGYLPTTDYTYVYIRTYDDPQHGYPDVWDIRESTQFDDTWVFAVENELFQNNISQEQNLSSEFKYYLTIGAFAIKNNAVNFLSYVQQKNLYDVHVVYSPTTEYFYVYVDTFPTFKLGSPSVFEYRDQTEFYDTWLFGFHDSDLVQEEMIIDEFVAQNKRNNNTQVIGGSQATQFSPDLITSSEEIDKIQAGDLELAITFKALREEDGLTDDDILQQYAGEENAELSLDLSYLYAEGNILKGLAAEEDNEDVSYDRLAEIANMVSVVMKKHPNLTLAHEEELYVFLTKEIGQFINDENDLVRLVDIAVNRTSFSEELPLDLQKIVSKGNFHLADASNDDLMQANIDVIEDYRIQKSDIELAAIFNQLREEDGLTDNYILQRYAGEKHAELSLELSYLNTDGSIIKGLAAEENSDMPYDRLSEIANMVSGVIRKHPNLTLEHEEEMYVFLSEENGQYIDDSNDLLRLVNKAINRTDFNEEEPLDLQEIIARGNFHLADTGADDVMQANIDIIEIPRVLTSEFELASVFKQSREEGGLTDGEILNQHADENNAELSLGLSYLNPEGSAIENLASPENIDVPYNRLYEIAGMISVVMKKHPNLTQEHEEEMYVFLTEEIGQYIYEEDDMIRLVDRVVNKKSFDVELPLELQEVGSKGNFHLADMVEDKLMQKNLDDIVVEKVLVSDIELAQVFRQLRTENGFSDKEILLQHPEAKNVKFILKLSYLNPEGTIINNFKSLVNLDISYRRLVAVAEMISEVRKGYPDLTVEHEEEIYTFLTKQIGQFIFDGNDLLELVDIAVNLKEYDVELPLDLEAIVLQGDYHLTDAVADSVMQANAELVEVEVIPRTYVDKDGRYKMYFYTFISTTYRRIKGNIEVIDPVRLKQMSIEKANKRTTIPDPNNQSESIEVIANIFGYKKVQHDFKMSEPFDSLAANFLHFKGDVLMVDFPLTRYETGDVGTMFNVYFYKDAAVMKSDSKYELKELLVMLQENLNYRIKIHGHTNGNAPGKIIKLEEGATNFFSLEGTKEGFGSSKELSLQRAELIKSYLVENGVDADRMEVKGWGGKKSIYDKFDRRALKNVRVEIEITAD